ncbi:MAG: hypothetical protein L0Y56_00275, partial [Nitrospira sp.]|nr:hypothetical protein [Nitrospira sp.]
MKILLAQNMVYIPSHGGANKGNRKVLEGLTEKKHSCLAVVRSLGGQGSRTRAQFLDELAVREIHVISSSSGVDVFHHKGVEVHAAVDVYRLRDCLVKQIREFEPTWT